VVHPSTVLKWVGGVNTYRFAKPLPTPSRWEGIARGCAL